LSRGPLEDFYSSLNDEQKAQFNMIGLRSRRGNSVVEVFGIELGEP
jgi:hypothetical protein